MKKKLIFIGGIIAAIVFLGVVISAKQSVNKEVRLSTNDKIKLEAVISQEGSIIELNIYNNGSETAVCDLQYEIQVKEGTEWKTYAEEINVDAIAIEILPNAVNTQNIVLDPKKIESGKTYRIRKVIGEFEYDSNEFQIEK